MCGRRSKGDTSWWNEEVRRQFKERTMHRSGDVSEQYTEDSRRRYMCMKNKAKKSSFKSNEREKAEEALTVLQNCPSWMFRLVKGID